ncbi:helix-turn-helix domain-containing protein [Streptomyces sp. NPDC017941]|uniref:helix-turn-helix domain-containing protein n=1 Tax=Streptomyces sp. NPDC017941 TaxID=3365018 RepID=UPI00379BC247
MPSKSNTPGAAGAPAGVAPPPTPAVPLAALLAHEGLGLRQIAGPDAAATGAVVHWVHTSEMADPYPYLLGGELLLTAGVHIPGADAHPDTGTHQDTGPGTRPDTGTHPDTGTRPDAGTHPDTGTRPGTGTGTSTGANADTAAHPDTGPGTRPGTGTHPDTAARLDTYAARIVAAGGAALGFGVAPVHDTVPRALLAACDRHGLPLLEVPPRTTFSGIARAVWQLMAEARHAELRRVTQAQQGLAAAAARPDAVPALLRQLAVRLGGYAALYGPDGTPTRAAGAPPGAEAAGALVRLAGVVNPGRAAAAATARGTAKSPPTKSTPTEGPPAKSPPMEGPPTKNPPTEGPPTKSPSTEGPPAQAPRPVPAAASDTVAGVHLAAYPLAGAHGLALGVATPRREPGDHTLAGVAAVLLSLLTAPHQGAAESARSAALVRLLLGARPEDVLPLLGAERWTVVQARVRHEGPGQGPPDPVALAAALGSTLVDGAAPVVRLLLPADRRPAPQDGWALGVSAPAGAGSLPAADAQAARALRRAEATRAALVRHRESGLAGLVAPAEAEAHARALLAPLGGSAPLTETLRTWLSLHGSWDRTAAALSVHRNTVRQRVTRCATLLAADLDDPDVRMDLWFALGTLGHPDAPARTERGPAEPPPRAAGNVPPGT